MVLSTFLSGISRHAPRWLACGSLAILLFTAGCQSLFTRSQSPEDEEEDESAELRIDKVGDHVTVAGLHTQEIEGVALVVNLDGTGGDPSPSNFRTLLSNEMKKRGVKQVERTLADPSTALVVVRAVLPPAIEVGDRFDVEVVIPESANATSLANGFLLPCQLTEHAFVPGKGHLPGHVLGRAGGPVMVTINDADNNSTSGMLKRGKVLGGGVFTGGTLKEDRPLELYLRSDFRSFRNVKRVADRIGRRFHATERGIKKPLSNATTDQHIELQIHPRYKHNYVRYVQVIRQITLSETPVEERARMERLKKSLLVPQTASASALDLEAIGGDGAIAVLREGLKSPNEEVRFYSADALAYLGSSEGSAELARAAENEDAFRVFALAALSILDDEETRGHLRRLMNEFASDFDADADDSAAVQLASNSEPGGGAKRHGAETRYGAFRALWTLDKSDGFIRGEPINDEFRLHILRTTGEPMVHLSRSRVQEVVLFGAEQELRRPVTLTAGRHIRIDAPSGSGTITLSRFEVGKSDRQKTVSPRVADVIRAIGELGGSYPDVAQMLTQAKRQANLEGRLDIDALPQAGRIYYRKPAQDSRDAKPEETRIGQPDRAPNIYPHVDDQDASALDRLSRTPAADADSKKDGKQDAEVAAASKKDANAESNEDAPPQQDGGNWFSKMFKNPFNSGDAPEQSEPEIDAK